MTLINAGKQARYRERALRDPDRLPLTRVRVLIGPRAAMDLVRIRKRTGWTSRGRWKGGAGDAHHAIEAYQRRQGGCHPSCRPTPSAGRAKTSFCPLLPCSHLGV